MKHPLRIAALLGLVAALTGGEAALADKGGDILKRLLFRSQIMDAPECWQFLPNADEIDRGQPVDVLSVPSTCRDMFA